MMLRTTIRRFSTKSTIDKLFNALQSSSENERQATLVHCIETSLQQGERVYPNFVNDVMHRWAIEQPTTEALWLCETNSNESQKLTYNDIYVQSSRFANVLTGKEFNLTPGKSVLVILPNDTKERILLQLACHQSGLTYCPYDPKDLSDIGISQRIRALSIDCVITNKDNLEIVMKYTHNPLRPMKKGLITNCSTSELLPVGWNHLIRSANDAENKYTKVINIQPNTSAIRFMSNNQHVIQYSQENFNFRLLLTAFWFNINKTSRLIWMKNENETISIAPWLFGSSIFYKQSENLKTMLNTFENNPIDTFCASSVNYQMLDKHKQQNNTHLNQLFSTESIDRIIESRWHSLTNIHIHDDYADFNNKSKLYQILKSFSNTNKQNTRLRDYKAITDSEECQSFMQSIPSPNIPSKSFVYNYSTIQDQKILNKISRI